MIKRFINWWNHKTPPVPEWLACSIQPVVREAWASGFTVSSDIARREAAWVATAATLQLITTREADGSFGRTWRVTKEGIRFLEEYWENEIK